MMYYQCVKHTGIDIMNLKEFLNQFATQENADKYYQSKDYDRFLEQLTGLQSDHKWVSILEAKLLDIIEEQTFEV